MGQSESTGTHARATGDKAPHALIPVSASFYSHVKVKHRAGRRRQAGQDSQDQSTMEQHKLTALYSVITSILNFLKCMYANWKSKTAVFKS